MSGNHDLVMATPRAGRRTPPERGGCGSQAPTVGWFSDDNRTIRLERSNKRGIVGIGHPLQDLGVVVVADTAHQLYVGQPAVGIEAPTSLEIGGDL